MISETSVERKSVKEMREGEKLSVCEIEGRRESE